MKMVLQKETVRGKIHSLGLQQLRSAWEGLITKSCMSCPLHVRARMLTSHSRKYALTGNPPNKPEGNEAKRMSILVLLGQISKLGRSKTKVKGRSVSSFIFRPTRHQVNLACKKHIKNHEHLKNKSFPVKRRLLTFT